MLPKNWPKNFFYKEESEPVEMHRDFLRLYLSTGNANDLEIISPLIEEKKVHPHIQIKPLSAFQNHPLKKEKNKRGHRERGVFSKHTIPQGTVLGEYVGEVAIVYRDSSIEDFFLTHKFSEYAWVANVKDLYYFVDSQKIANELAFVNDYRGLQDKPNVSPKWIVHRGSYYFGLTTIDEIPAGRELLADYGNAYWEKNAEKPPLSNR